ncbi:hypothetical protein [Bacillus sp. Au-Bac7]|nr:hypothetical protein [Bacillus sp. Au-Bac7]
MRNDDTITAEKHDFVRGLTIGMLLSIPLWLSFFGWVKIIIRL